MSSLVKITVNQTTDLVSVKVFQAENGAQGDRAGLKYTFSTSTGPGAPSPGYLKFNSATLSAVTQIAIRDTDFDGANTTALLALIDDSTSTMKARVLIRSNSNSDTSNFNFLVTSVTDEGNHFHINGTYVSGSAFADDEVVTFDFYMTGDLGATGPAPSGTGFVKVVSGVLQTPSASIAQADVTNLTSDLALKAPLISPSFTTPSLGVATATTITCSDYESGIIGHGLNFSPGNATLSVGGSGTFGLSLNTLQFAHTNGSGRTAVFYNAITSDVVLGIPNSGGTIALTSDITGTNSGTNTGDQFTAVTSQRLIGRHAGGSGAAQEVQVGDGIEFSGSGIRRSALTGDITASAGSNATTLASTIAGAKTLSGQLELTGQAATTANSAMTRALVEASFSNPITQGGTIIQAQATALSRSTLLNGGTSLIPTIASPTPRVTCTTTLDSSAVLRAIASDGVTSRCDSSNQKLFADKYGWFFIGFLGARGVGSRGKLIIGGNSTPAEMIVEGTLGSDGIALESYPLVANTPRFRLVVRNGATTTVGAFSGTGVYSIAQLGQWWIVMESGTTSAYYRLEQGAWNLICSVAAVPATSAVVSGNGIAIVAYTPDAGAAGGSSIQLNTIYETFGITPD